MITEGIDEKEIKRKCLEENMFGAAKEYRAKRMYGYLWNRVNKLDKELVNTENNQFSSYS